MTCVYAIHTKFRTTYNMVSDWCDVHYIHAIAIAFVPWFEYPASFPIEIALVPTPFCGCKFWNLTYLRLLTSLSFSQNFHCNKIPKLYTPLNYFIKNLEQYYAYLFTRYSVWPVNRTELFKVASRGDTATSYLFFLFFSLLSFDGSELFKLLQLGLSFFWCQHLGRFFWLIIWNLISRGSNYWRDIWDLVKNSEGTLLNVLMRYIG